MSHFCTVVLVKQDVEGYKIGDEVERLLAPYDENIEVDEYETDCWCLGQGAERAVRKASEEKFGPLEEFRKEFNKRTREGQNFEKMDDDALHAHRRETAALWREETKERFEWEDKATKTHPRRNDPEPDCESCNGTGKHMTTYNPKSKWDWWVVGGRWDGYVQDREAERRDDTGFNFGDEHHQIVNNEMPADKLAFQIEKTKDFGPPYAIVTPDGEWHSRGEMGGFGMSSDEDDDWPARAVALLNQHHDCVAIGCDLHI
jgi:hypothetical protein